MAIVPLDLQVLYSQLETVSKRVAHQQQGTQLANAIQQEAHAQQMAEKNSTVQQLQSGEDGIQKSSPSFQQLTQTQSAFIGGQ